MRPATNARAGSGDEIDPRRVWLGVAGELWRREPSHVERLASRLLRSAGLARALVITPSLMLSWLVASLVVITVGAVATAATGTPFVALFAPPVAACGIAFAYGPGIDPAWELARSTAVDDRLVLLVRALVVFALNALIGLVAGLGGWALAVVGGRAADGAFTAAVTDPGWRLVYLSMALCCGAVAVFALRGVRGPR